MRACVIFNPTAKGEKAARFRRHLDEIGAECALKMTTCAGDARRLASEAVGEGFDTITAAGGDGTVNEVLNGIGDAAGFERVRLAVLPLGTVNVFARELQLPLRVELAWKTVLAGREARVDLPRAEFLRDGKPEARWFAQLAGAGLDARAVELVSWPLKKRIGPLAYIWAGLVALTMPRGAIRVAGDGTTQSGELILVGNGRLYGGNYRVFPRADLNDGLLDVCVFPRVNWLTLARCGPQMLLRGTLPASRTRLFQAAELKLESDGRMPFQIDGELAGTLPARITLHRDALRIIVP